LFSHADHDKNGTIGLDEVVTLMTNDICDWHALADHVGEVAVVEEYEAKIGAKASRFIRKRRVEGVSTPDTFTASPGPFPPGLSMTTSDVDESIESPVSARAHKFMSGV
jgi:hypothetical protein